MTGRERVLAAMRHEQPDRTPLFERIVKSPHSDRLLGRPCAATNFECQMGYLADGGWAELCAQQAADLADLAETLGYDMIAVGPNGGPPAERPERVAPGRWRLGGFEAHVNESGWVQYESLVPPTPPVSEVDQARVLRAQLETPYRPSEDPDAFVVFREVRRLLAERDLDLAIYTSCYTMPVCTLSPNQLMWLHTDPELMHALYRRQSEIGCDIARRSIAQGAHIVGLGGDLASDAGPVVSPAHYREFVVPEVRRQADLVHELGAYATNTSDGNLRPVLDDFLLATDVDGFGEIDFVAGMDLAELKRAYGERICFLGNLDIRFTLTRGTPEECRRHMLECIEAGWGDGGHIVMTSNVVHEDVSLANYLACLAAYREHFGLEALAV